MDISDWAAQLYQRKITELQDQIKALDIAFRSCESPIEQYFLMSYIDRWRPQAILLPDRSGYAFLMEDSGPGNDYISVFPQFALRLGDRNYRADFLFNCMSQEGRGTRTVVVELDGHDFHERTKEQAQRDRARDRRMTRSGFHVFRFTGSEIYRDVESAVDEVRTFALEGSKAA